jgi:site-specific recombinase XerD
MPHATLARPHTTSTPAAAPATVPAETAVLTDPYVAAFLARYTGGTRQLYERHLRTYLAWCTTQGLDPWTATRIHVETYTRHLAERGHAASTIHSELSPVRGLYRLAHGDGLIPRDPTAQAWAPKVTRDPAKFAWLDRLELARWITVARGISARHWAVATLAGVLALRATEIASLRVESVTERDGHRVFDFIGKGDKHAVMPLPVPVQRAVDAAIGNRDTGWLITQRDGVSPLNRHGIGGLVDTICRRAGTKPLTPHAVRRSCITAALDAGIPLRDVQALARHADPSTTVLYDRNADSLDRHAVHSLASWLAA